VVSLLFALVRPLRLSIYRLWMYAQCSPIGWTVTHLIMAAAVFRRDHPAGLAPAVRARCPGRRLDPNARSYPVERRQSSSVEPLLSSVLKPGSSGGIVSNSEKSNRSAVEQAAGRRRSGMLVELWGLLSQTKKWWLAPIIVMMLLVGVLVILGGSAAAPFIYTLF
jgi:hypothetical protein